MSRTSPGAILLVLVSLAVSLVLAVAPIPEILGNARPLWLALVLAYWAFVLPGGFSLVLAWLCGLVLDVLYGSVFGLNALFCLFVVVAVLQFRQRLRMFPYWQQSVFFLVVFVVGQFVLFWPGWLAGEQARLLDRMLPALVSALLWPWVYTLLQLIGRLSPGSAAR